MRDVLMYQEGNSVKIIAKLVKIGVRRSLMDRDTKRGMKKTALLADLEVYDKADNYLGTINHMWIDYEKVLQQVKMYEPFMCYGKVIRYKKGNRNKYFKLPSECSVFDLTNQYDYTLRHLYNLEPAVEYNIII